MEYVLICHYPIIGKLFYFDGRIFLLNPDVTSKTMSKRVIEIHFQYTEIMPEFRQKIIKETNTPFM